MRNRRLVGGEGERIRRDRVRDFRCELEAARRVQQRLCPASLPQLADWEVAVLFRPMREVAGDFYDLVPLGDQRLAVFQADVCGKGLGAGMVTAGLHAWLRSQLALLPHLAGLIDGLNAYLLTLLPDDLFVTVFLSVLHTTTGRLEYVNAGHPSPRLFRGPGQPALILESTGPIAGVFPEAEYQQRQLDLPPGSLFLLCTDGILDAVGPLPDPLNRLGTVADEPVSPTPVSVVQYLDGRLRQRGQFDDVCVVAFRRSPVSLE